MGEAKRRRATARPIVYHHTSTLRTNLIWMSGVIDVEGSKTKVLHPHLGEVGTDPRLRRKMTDFPPVAWFTRRIEIPKVLMISAMHFEDKQTGAIRRVEVGTEMMHGMVLNRIALGFPLAAISVTPWPEYYGYGTPEGRELNETARDAGDNSDDWYVSETPVDVMNISECWSSRAIFNPKLQRTAEKYVSDIKSMVTRCRETKGVFILPTWLRPEQARALAKEMGIEAVEP